MRPALVLRRVKRKLSPKAKFKILERPPRRITHDRLPKGIEEAAREALKRRPYYDLANSTLDFTKTNKMLLHDIKHQSTNRVRLRIRDPANVWSLLHGNMHRVGDLKREAALRISGAKFSLESSLRPLSVGDIVLLNNNSTQLHLVVAAPNTLSSNVYTFINHEGEVTFGTKHHIQLRIPGVFTHAKTESMNLVAIEEKFHGVAPIGVPDSAFSRKKAEPPSRPRDLRIGQAKTPEALLLPLEPALASLESGPREFIVSQALAQLLTDIGVNTYIVPTSAREVYSEHFTRISIDAFLKVTDFGNRLNYFHKVLQYDDSGCLIQSSRTIPIFELFRMVTSEEVPPSSEDEYKATGSLLRQFKERNTQSLGLPLPSQTARDFAVENHLVSSYIAFISALSRSGRKWKLNVQVSTKMPISVDVLPLTRASLMESTLEYLKNGGIQEMSSYIASLIETGNPKSPVPLQYEPVLQMLKDFVVGNITKDHAMDSLLGCLIRSIDTKLRAAGLAQTFSVQFAPEFARLRAYEILMCLEKTGDVNPLRWDSALALPGTNTSRDSDKFQQFYDFLDTQVASKLSLFNELETGTSKQRLAEKDGSSTDSILVSKAVTKYLADDFYARDPMAAMREDFGDTPVYCIDSETAHEIDDGISVQDFGRRVMVTVHIANPTSFLKPESSLSQIAFGKGSSIYLPEGPTMMLPGVVSKLCGLNGNKNTRTLGIQFLLSKKHVKAYHEELLKDPSAKPLDDLAKLVQKAITQTSTVKFYTVSNFPKGYTYKKVNEVLNDPQNILKYHSNELVEGSHEDNLFQLHTIADLIKHFRVMLGSGFGVDSDPSKVTVTYTKDEIPPETAFAEVENGWQIALPKGDKIDAPVITVAREVKQNKDSKSQHLVSNLMIAANFAGSMFAHRQRFPIIFRHQELDAKESVWKEIRKLQRSNYLKGRELRPDEKLHLLSVTTSASYLTFPYDHHMLGLSLYLNLTSPLRRYVDMVNHWKFQDYTLLKEQEKLGTPYSGSSEMQLVREKRQEEPEIKVREPPPNKKLLGKARKKLARQVKEAKTVQKARKAKLLRVALGRVVDPELRKEFGMRTSDMDYVACHLQGCELRNKNAQRFSDAFWMAKFLRRYFEMSQLGQITTPIEFLFLLGSDAKHGDVRAELLGFNSLKTTILQTPHVMQKFACEEWTVGQVLQNPRFQVVKLDFIEGEFTVEILLSEETSDVVD